MSDEAGLLFGYHAVLAALRSGRAVEVVWLQDGRRDRKSHEVMSAARKAGVAVKLVDRRRLDRLSGETPHNGCVARSAPVTLRQLDDLIAPSGEPGRLLVLDSLEDPHNIGAIVRTAAAFAVDGVVLAGPSAPPLGGALAKAAAGQLERMPVARATVAADVLAVLRAADYWVFGADGKGRAIGADPGVNRWALCLGSEGRGLRAKTRSQVDELIAVPIDEGVESLNVSVATGILLYELSRPRG